MTGLASPANCNTCRRPPALIEEQISSFGNYRQHRCRGSSKQLPGVTTAITGVLGMISDDLVPMGKICVDHGRRYPCAASGCPHDLEGVRTADNLWGNSLILCTGDGTNCHVWTQPVPRAANFEVHNHTIRAGHSVPTGFIRCGWP